MGRKAKQEPIYYDRKFNADLRKKIWIKRQQLGLSPKSAAASPQAKPNHPNRSNDLK